MFMTNGKSDEGRIRVVQLKPQFIVDVLNWSRAPEGAVLDLPETDEIPDDVKVVSIDWNVRCRCIDVLVYHDSVGGFRFHNWNFITMIGWFVFTAGRN